MPFVNVKIAGPTLAPEQVHQLQDQATRLMATVMRKKPELTAVLVEQVAVQGWSVGAHTVQAAAQVDVKVTAGTNTREEKTRFVEQAMQLLRDVLGADLNPVAYVVVHEVAADAWGYDGRTQADRASLANAA